MDAEQERNRDGIAAERVRQVVAALQSVKWFVDGEQAGEIERGETSAAHRWDAVRVPLGDALRAAGVLLEVAESIDLVDRDNARFMRTAFRG